MRNLAILLCVSLLPALVAARKAPKPKAAPAMTVKEGPTGDLFAVFQTSLGDIVVKLYEKDAPRTVENFVALATGKKEWKDPTTGQWVTGQPLYDNTWFHRVIPKFMIQGGDPYTRGHPESEDAGRGGPGFSFADEFANGHKFDKPGYLAMANSGPNTNGSQFFITEVPTPHLTDLHTIFGEVVSGLELVPSIANAGNMKVQLVKLTILRGTLVPRKNTARK